eukprot:gene12180-16314_t
MKLSSAEKKSLNSKRKESFFRLISVAKSDFPSIISGMIALIVNGITNLSFPYIMGKTLDMQSKSSADAASTSSELIMNNNNDNLSNINLGFLSLNGEYKWFIYGSASALIVGSIASCVRVYCLGTATDNIAGRLRKELFDSFMEKDMEFFDENNANSGELITVLERDCTEAAEVLTERMAGGLRSINSSINGSILLYSISPKLCGVSLSVVPVVGIGAMTLSKASRKVAEKLREAQGSILSYSLERLQNYSTVRLNGRQEYEQKQFANMTNKSFELSKKRYYSHGTFMGFINLATNVSLIAVLRVGGGMIGSGEITKGDLIRFAIQSAFVGLGFSGLSTFYSDMIKALDAAT